MLDKIVILVQATVMIGCFAFLVGYVTYLFGKLLYVIITTKD